MDDRPVPYAWEGRQVVASILEAGGYTVGGSPLPLEVPERTGTLEKVTELGILASLAYAPEYEREDHEPNGTFYPWSAVLSLRLAEG